MSAPLKTLLQKNRISSNEKDSVDYSHVLLTAPCGNYNFDNRNYEDFWKAYSDLIYDTPDAVCGLAEKPSHYSPVLNDTDLKVQYDSTIHSLNKPLYSEAQLKAVVCAYQTVLAHVLVKVNAKQLVAFVMEKAPRIDGSKFCHGFHIHFRYAQLSNTDQILHVIPRVRDTVGKGKVFESIGISDSSTVIDDCTKKPWLMYGSRKSEHLQPYRLTRIYDNKCENMWTADQLGEVLIRFNDKIKDMSGEEVRIPEGKTCLYHLPRMFSIFPLQNKIPIAEVKSGMNIPYRRTLIKAEKVRRPANSNEPVSELLIFAAKLMKLIKPSRADNHPEWIDIGFSLHALSQGCQEGLDLWLEFSQKTSKPKYYDEKYAVLKWKEMVAGKRTIGSLIYIAKHDDPTGYKALEKEENKTKFKFIIGGAHYDLAYWLHQRFRENFVCAVPSKKIWYKFERGHWSQDQAGFGLRSHISTTLYEEFKNHKVQMLETYKSVDLDAHAMLQQKNLQKIMNNLKNAGFKNMVMTECIAEGSRVCTAYHSSKQIQMLDKELQFKLKYPKLLGWSTKDCNLVVDNQTNFIPKGTKSCVEIKLIDNSKIIVTPEHQFLCSDGTWTAANDLVIKESRIKTGIVFPDDLLQDFKFSDTWSAPVSKSFSMTIKNRTAVIQLSAYCRLIGYFSSLDFSLTDQNEEKESRPAYKEFTFATKYDTNIFQSDIKIVQGLFDKDTKMEYYKHTDSKSHKVKVKCNTDMFDNFFGIKYDTFEAIPDFLLDKNCPQAFVKDYLAGYFSSAATSVTLSKVKIASIEIKKTKLNLHRTRTLILLDNLQLLLKSFGVISYVIDSPNRIFIDRNAFMNASLVLEKSTMNMFYQKIGYSYNLVNYFRLKAISSFMDYRADQLNMCKEMDLVAPIRIQNIHTYLTETSAIKYFYDDVMTDYEGLPTMNVPVKSRTNAGEHKVYDLTMERTASFIANGFVVHNCCELFRDQDFVQKLDSDSHLIGFSNGVLDLRMNPPQLRETMYDDYISLSTGYDYKEFNENDTAVRHVYEYFEKVFTDEKLRIYFIEYCANLLKGGNDAKTFVLLTGGGENSKSVAISFIQNVLGRYMIVLPTTLITGQRTQSSQATPELARMCGIRFAVLQEPSSRDVMNTGVLKELSGNDKFYVRPLYGEGFEMIPLFKLALICNKLPRVAGDDPATWNRIRVVPFTSCFPKDKKLVPSDPKDQIEQRIFPRDNEFDQKLPDMTQAFMWILVQTYKKLKRRGFSSEPESVRQATDIYRKNNDVLSQFIEEKVIKDKTGKLGVIEIYDVFKRWFKEANSNAPSAFTKPDLKDELIKRWGKPFGNYKWIGYRIKNADDVQKQEDSIDNMIVENLQNIDLNDTKTSSDSNTSLRTTRSQTKSFL